MCLSAQRVSHPHYANLDQTYLREEEWILILNKTLDYNANEINSFRDDMKTKILKIKHEKVESVTKYCRSEDYNLTFFLSEALNAFNIIYEKEKQIKATGTMGNNLQLTARFTRAVRQHNGTAKMTALDMLMGEGDDDESGDITKISQTDKIKEKERLVSEIKDIIKKTNQYKISCVKLMAYIGEIDPIYTEIKQLVNEQRDAIVKIRRDKVTGRLQDDFNNQINMGMMNFIEKGSSLTDTNSKNLLKLLLNTDTRYYKTLTERKAEYVPHVKRMIKNLREKIFNEKFSILKGKESRNVENLKLELQKIFERYQNVENSDYFLLSACFKNAEITADNELTIDNVLDRVSNKIVAMVNKVLLEDSDFDDDEEANEELMKKNYETGQKKFEELSKAEENVNQAINESNTKLLNELIKEQNVNMKKKPEEKREIQEETVEQIYDFYDNDIRESLKNENKTSERSSLTNQNFFEQHRQSKISNSSKGNMEKTVPANLNQQKNVFDSDLHSLDTEKKAFQDANSKANYANDEIGKNFTSFNPQHEDRKSLLSFKKGPNFESFMKKDNDNSNNNAQENLKDSLPVVGDGYDRFEDVGSRPSRNNRNSAGTRLSKITEQADTVDHEKESFAMDFNNVDDFIDRKRPIDDRVMNQMMREQSDADQRTSQLKPEKDSLNPNSSSLRNNSLVKDSGSLERKSRDLSRSGSIREQKSGLKQPSTYADIHKKKEILRGSIDKSKDDEGSLDRSLEKKQSVVLKRSGSKLDNLIQQQNDKDKQNNKRMSDIVAFNAINPIESNKKSLTNNFDILDTKPPQETAKSLGEKDKDERKSSRRNEREEIRKVSNDRKNEDAEPRKSLADKKAEIEQPRQSQNNKNNGEQQPRMSQAQKNNEEQQPRMSRAQKNNGEVLPRTSQTQRKTEEQPRMSLAEKKDTDQVPKKSLSRNDKSVENQVKPISLNRDSLNQARASQKNRPNSKVTEPDPDKELDLMESVEKPKRISNLRNPENNDAILNTTNRTLVNSIGSNKEDDILGMKLKLESESLASNRHDDQKLESNPSSNKDQDVDSISSGVRENNTKALLKNVDSAKNDKPQVDNFAKGTLQNSIGPSALTQSKLKQSLNIIPENEELEIVNPPEHFEGSDINEIKENKIKAQLKNLDSGKIASTNQEGVSNNTQMNSIGGFDKTNDFPKNNLAKASNNIQNMDIVQRVSQDRQQRKTGSRDSLNRNEEPRISQKHGRKSNFQDRSSLASEDKNDPNKANKSPPVVSSDDRTVSKQNSTTKTDNLKQEDLNLNKSYRNTLERGSKPRELEPVDNTKKISLNRSSNKNEPNVQPQDNPQSILKQYNDVDQSGVKETAKKTGLTYNDSVQGEAMLRGLEPRESLMNSLVDKNAPPRQSNTKVAPEEPKNKEKTDSLTNRQDKISNTKKDILNDKVEKIPEVKPEQRKSTAKQQNEIEQSGVRESIKKTGLTYNDSVQGEAMLRGLEQRQSLMNSLAKDNQQFQRQSNTKTATEEPKPKEKTDSLTNRQEKISNKKSDAVPEKPNEIKNNESEIKLSDGSAIREAQEKKELKNIESGGDKKDSISGPKNTILNSLVDNVKNPTKTSFKRDDDIKLTGVESDFNDFKQNLDNHLQNEDIHKPSNDTTILGSDIRFTQNPDPQQKKSIKNEGTPDHKSQKAEIEGDKNDASNLVTPGNSQIEGSKLDKLRSAIKKQNNLVSQHIGITETGEKNVKNFFKNFWGAKPGK